MLSALFDCLRFYSRLPVPVFAFEKDPHGLPDFGRIIVMLPVAGAIIALPAAMALIVADLFWSPLIASCLAIGVLVLSTGAFHEDGLADVADGFGGGQTIARRLEIMTDSRIGTYGGAALVLSLMLRISVLADLVDGIGGTDSAQILVAVAGLSRLAGLLPLMLLDNAKPDGKAAAVGKPATARYLTALLLGLMLTTALLWSAGFDSIALLLAICGGLVAPLPLLLLARRLIGGQTGDVAGAAQQASEVAMLLVLSACNN